MLVDQTVGGDDGRRQGQAVAVGVEMQLVVEAHGGQGTFHFDLDGIGELGRQPEPSGSAGLGFNLLHHVLFASCRRRRARA